MSVKPGWLRTLDSASGLDFGHWALDGGRTHFNYYRRIHASGFAASQCGKAQPDLASAQATPAALPPHSAVRLNLILHRSSYACGSAAAQCGKALPYRQVPENPGGYASPRGRASREKRLPERRSLSALCGGEAARVDRVEHREERTSRCLMDLDRIRWRSS
jgi:hypothetical protein